MHIVLILSAGIYIVLTLTMITHYLISLVLFTFFIVKIGLLTLEEPEEVKNWSVIQVLLQLRAKEKYHYL